MSEDISIRVCTEEDILPFYMDMDDDYEPFDLECPSCGQLLDWDDVFDHDDKACIEYMEMVRKYYNMC